MDNTDGLEVRGEEIDGAIVAGEIQVITKSARNSDGQGHLSTLIEGSNSKTTDFTATNGSS